MDTATLLAKTRDHIRQLLADDSAGHDWHHIDRVCRSALTIAREEGADPVVVELAALLHDIADWKFAGGDEKAGPQAARAWLQSLNAPSECIDHVCSIIDQLSFKGAGVQTPMSSLEGKCVQDADRLDAIGAIGIGRAFAYGGFKGRLMHDPAVPPQLHDSFEAYKKNTGPTLNHFYEKLLLLKDRMNTPAGRRLAEGRHRFMEQYLEQFLAEWEGHR